MTQLDDAQAEQFSTKLKDFRETLTGEEQALFDAILDIAWHVGAKEEDLDDGFDGSFSPEEADLILAYHSGELDRIAGMIRGSLIRGSAHGLIRGKAAGLIHGGDGDPQP